jgi:haloacid dehalogenase-like hydrolase
MALQSLWKTHESCGSDDPIDSRRNDEEGNRNNLPISGYRPRLAHRRVGPSCPQTGSERVQVTPAHFRRFMFAQSKPYPEMIQLVRNLKVRHGLKIAAVSNEARELNSHRIRTFGLDGFMDLFISSCFVHLRKPDADIFGLRWMLPRCLLGGQSISKTRQCSSRSRKVWEFEAFFARTPGPRARNLLRGDCRMIKESSLKAANPRVWILRQRFFVP